MNDCTVLPVGVLDATHVSQSIALFGWILDKRIDDIKVRDAWVTLITAWPILAARLHRSTKNITGWEYHIPQFPDVERCFTTLPAPGSITSHCELVKRSDRIVCSPAPELRHLFMPQAPKSFERLIEQELPMTRLHITTFEDASMVAIYVPHILCDAYGITVIMRNLVRVLDGHPPPAALDHQDPFRRYKHNFGNINSAPTGWRTLTSADKAVLYAREMWDQMFDGPLESRNVFFPAAEVDRIKHQAMDELRTMHRDHRVSTSEAIVAFCLKCLYPSATSVASKGTVNVFYAVNMRPILSLSSDYIHNAVGMVVTPTLSASDICKLSLGEIAMHLRHALAEQTSATAITQWVEWMLRNSDREKVFYDPWQGHGYVISNCRSLRIESFDFSAALPDFDENDGSPADIRKVHCTQMWHHMVQPSSHRNRIVLCADPSSRGVWMNACFPRRIWEDERGFGKFRPKVAVAKL